MNYPDPVLPDNNPPHVDAKNFYLGGLFAIALLTVCYLAADLIMPIVLALVLKLVFQPVMRFLQRLRLPRMLAALLIILGLLFVLVGLGAALSLPATNWIQKLPTALPQIQEKLTVLQSPLKAFQNLLHRAEGITTVTTTTPAAPTVTVAVQDNNSLSSQLLRGTRNFASGLFEMLIILLFMLGSGDTFLRRLVEILPRLEEKKRAVSISQQIESDISGYLATITLMNIGVGVLTMLIMLICGRSDALLWGTVAFLLNYIPIIGPIINMIILTTIGLLTTPTLGAAFLPVGLYFLVHLTEGQFVTPMLLARRFTLNPVLVILALVFWYWMWGVPGAILATPLLAITKIICDRIEPLQPFGHFMEG